MGRMRRIALMSSLATAAAVITAATPAAHADAATSKPKATASIKAASCASDGLLHITVQMKNPTVKTVTFDIKHSKSFVHESKVKARTSTTFTTAFGARSDRTGVRVIVAGKEIAHRGVPKTCAQPAPRTTTPSPTPNPTPSVSPAPHPTPSPSSVVSVSPTPTPSPTPSPSPSPTSSPSPTTSPSSSATPSPSGSPTTSPTPTPSPSASPSPTVSPSPTTSPTPSAAPPTEWASPPATVKTLLQQINGYRAVYGSAPLKLDEGMSNAAAAHANYMAQNSYVGHSENATKPGYSQRGANAGGCGDEVRTINKGDDITSTGPGDPGGVQQWMQGAYHQILMLDPTYAWIGLGTATDSLGYTYASLTCAGQTSYQALPYGSCAAYGCQQPDFASPLAYPGQDTQLHWRTIGYDDTDPRQYCTDPALRPSDTYDGPQGANLLLTLPPSTGSINSSGITATLVNNTTGTTLPTPCISLGSSRGPLYVNTVIVIPRDALPASSSFTWTISGSTSSGSTFSETVDFTTGPAHLELDSFTGARQIWFAVDDVDTGALGAGYKCDVRFTYDGTDPTVDDYVWATLTTGSNGTSNHYTVDPAWGDTIRFRLDCAAQQGEQAVTSGAVAMQTSNTIVTSRAYN